MTKHQQDRRYAWIIVFAASVGNMICFGMVCSVSVFVVLFMDNVPSTDTAQIALIGSLHVSSYFFVAMLSGILSKRFGCRPVAVAAGSIAFLGLLMSSFSTNIYHLYLSYGLLAGVGLGLHSISNVAVVGEYVTENYISLVLGISCGVGGIGACIVPTVLSSLEDVYGWRGALLIMAGICFQLTLIGVLYRPAQKCDKGVDSKHTPYLHMFKNKQYMVLNVQGCLVWFALTIVLVHLAAMMRHLGFTNFEINITVTFLGLANTVGRLSWGAVNHFPRISTIAFYFWSIVGLAITTALFPWAYDLTLIRACVSSFGFMYGSYCSLMPQLIADLLGKNLMAVGFGFQCTVMTVFILASGPVAGLLVDKSGSYLSSMYLSTATFIVAALILIHQWINQGKVQGKKEETIQCG